MKQYIKIKAIVLFGLFSIVGYGQIDLELPVLSPQTPTTSDLGKYGEIQVNESTGNISPSIPLFNYETPRLTIPLSLNYSGNGVRVNQDPTWAGINWNINPGGVITRTVRDLPDELTETQNRHYFSKEELDNLEGAGSSYREIYKYTYAHPGTLGCTHVIDSVFYGHFLNETTEWSRTLKYIATEEAIDSEADIFNYNFPGYSGSFYLDKNNAVHLIKFDKEVKIIFQYALDNKSEIIIQTPQGDVFSFGGAFASESSKTWVNNGSASRAVVPLTQNAFYLHTISFFSGGTINFTYDDYKPTCTLYKTGIVENASVSFPVGFSPCNKTIKTLYCEIENAVRLKEISNSFTNQKVIFNTSFTGTCNRLLKLNSVSLLNGSSQIKKIKLEYLTINNEPDIAQNEFSDEDKFFLEKVEFYDRSNNFVHDYQLTYTTPHLFPSKKSFAQDHLGYYNGKNANTTLLPITTNNLLNDNCFFGLADREADFNSSLIGSLKKIQYPTKGSMEFQYELPYKGEVDNIVNHYLSVYYRDEYRNNTSQLTTTYYPAGFAEPLVLTQQKTINIGLNVMAKGSYSQQNNIKIEVLKKSGSNWVVYQTAQKFLTNAVGGTVNYSDSYPFTVAAGSYIFRISLNLITPTTDDSVIANATLALPQGTKPTYYPSLRIKKVVTHDGTNTLNAQIQRYYYNGLGSLTTERLRFHPNYISNTWSSVATDGHYGYQIFNLSTNNIRASFAGLTDGSFIYDFVTISYGGDNFENGGKEMEFYKVADLQPFLYNSMPAGENYDDSINLEQAGTIVGVGSNDYSYLNSTLLNEKYFNKDKKILKKTDNFYSGLEDNHMDNIKFIKVEITDGTLNYQFNGAFLLYKTKSFKTRLLSTVSKEYFGTNLTDEVTTTTNYTYASDKVSLPSTIETINSGGEISTTKLYYPSDVNSLTGYTSSDVATINTMGTNRHNVAQVIRSENLKNNNLIDTKQVYFNGQGLPKIISAVKGQGENSLEERVVIESYYFGKPAIVSLKDGTKTKYEYNTNLQVVLKIENYTGQTGTIDPIEFPVANTTNAVPPTAPSNCSAQEAYPDSMVTSYEYDARTHNLIKITDPKCNVATYHYDPFNRLEFIKDQNGNILSENKYNYKN